MTALAPATDRVDDVVVPEPAGRRHPVRRFVADHRWAVALFTTGALVRVAAMWVWSPTIDVYFDSVRFARVGMPFFGDFWMPAGYPVFLALLRPLFHSLTLTVVVQHALGLLGAGFLAGAARRAGVPRPYHLLAGATAVLTGDAVFFEHLVMADWLTLFWTCLGVYALARSCTGRRQLEWAVVSSIGFVTAGLTRSNALPLLGVAVVFGTFPIGRSRSRRAVLTRLAAFAVPGMLLLGAYVAIAEVNGPYAGLTDMSGWSLFPRVAPFVDCAKITADDAHPGICDTRPPSQRPGPYYYVWEDGSPTRRTLPLTPAGSVVLRKAGIQAILAQPVDYAKAVGQDLIRFFDPGYRAGAGHGQSMDVYSFRFDNAQLRGDLDHQLARRYGDAVSHVHSGQQLLSVYQDATRVTGWLLVLFLLAPVLAWRWAGRVLRRWLLATLTVAGVLLIVPIATLTWDFRYSYPPTVILSAAGGAAVGLLLARWRGADEPPADPEGPVGQRQ